MGNILPMMADSDSDLDIDPCAVSPTQDHDKNDEQQPVISDIIGSLKSKIKCFYGVLTSSFSVPV